MSSFLDLNRPTTVLFTCEPFFVSMADGGFRRTALSHFHFDENTFLGEW